MTAYTGVNLNNVKENMLESLVKYKFRKMVCAIDGASNEIYKIYRVNGSFEKVIQNIEKINYARDMLLGKKIARRDIPCTTCDIYLSRKSAGKTLKRGLLRLLYRNARFAYYSLSFPPLQYHGNKFQKLLNR